MKSPKIEAYRDAKGPPFADVERVLADLKSVALEDPAAARDRAMIHLMYDLGLRVSSVLSLSVSQFTVDNNGSSALRNIWLKGDRMAPYRSLPKRTRDALLDWLEHHEGEGKLFNVSDRYVRKITNDRGLGNPHGLRHSSATKLAKLGVPLPEIQAFLEHCDAATTSKYIDALTTDRGSTARLVAGES